MKNSFVPYAISEKLLKIGFDEPCIATIWRDEKVEFNIVDGKIAYRKNSEINTIAGFRTAVTYQQALNWLFDEKGLSISIDDDAVLLEWVVRVKESWSNNLLWSGHNMNYHEALNKAIEEAIKTIKN